MSEKCFRGKSALGENEGEWISGYLIPENENHFPIICCQEPELDKNSDCKGEKLVISDFSFVLPETVGQYIGEKDKNKKMIYEGDIVRIIKETENEYSNTIGYIAYVGCCFCLKNGNFSISLTNNFPFDEYDIEIIGNIYDNPEILDSRSPDNSFFCVQSKPEQ